METLSMIVPPVFHLYFSQILMKATWTDEEIVELIIPLLCLFLQS